MKIQSEEIGDIHLKMHEGGILIPFLCDHLEPSSIRVNPSTALPNKASEGYRGRGEKEICCEPFPVVWRYTLSSPRVRGEDDVGTGVLVSHHPEAVCARHGTDSAKGRGRRNVSK